jgi:hypothetical protein
LASPAQQLDTDKPPCNLHRPQNFSPSEPSTPVSNERKSWQCCQRRFGIPQTSICKTDQWYSQQNGKWVVFILNVTEAAVAHEMLEKLPLGQAHLMSFELIPLGPLAPLRQLSGIARKP